MRSSQGNESITVALIVAVIIGLAGGYFLIKMEERGRETPVAAASPAPAAPPAEASGATGDFKAMYMQGCVAGARQSPEARGILANVDITVVCDCLYPWIKSKLDNQEISFSDMESIVEQKRFPNESLQQELIKETLACFKKASN